MDRPVNVLKLAAESFHTDKLLYTFIFAVLGKDNINDPNGVTELENRLSQMPFRCNQSKVKRFP